MAATYNVDNDMYHPVHSQTHPDNESYYSQSSVAENSLSKKKKRELEELKAQDSGWRKITINDRNRVKRDVEYYSTNYAPNTLIRCPITGARTRCRVGTRDEDLFYVVCNSMGYNGQKTPDHLYYDTPDQYERHWGTVLGADERQRWFTKNLQERVNQSSKL